MAFRAASAAIPPNVAMAGTPPSRARAFVIALHGRGGAAASILALANALGVPGVCALAPEAPTGAWYPNSFIAPTAANQPHLSAALARVHGLLDGLAAAGVPDGCIGLMGFSQGACLALEAAITRPRAYGAMIAFSGGYIGPLGAARAAVGRLDGARAFLGCSDRDSHIPLVRVHETTALLTAMGATVIERIYPGLGHTIIDDELAYARASVGAMAQSPANSVGDHP